MVEYWAWAILLLVSGLALATMEIFIPSGGILGFLAVAALVASVINNIPAQRFVVGLVILATAAPVCRWSPFWGSSFGPERQSEDEYS